MNTHDTAVRCEWPFKGQLAGEEKCLQEAVAIIQRERSGRAEHPATRRYVGLLVCEHHRDVCLRMDERYGLGLAVRRLGSVPHTF